MTQKKEYFANNCSLLLKGIFNTSVFLLNFAKRCTLHFFLFVSVHILDCKYSLLLYLNGEFVYTYDFFFLGYIRHIRHI